LQCRLLPFGKKSTRAHPPPSKGGGKAGSLGRNWEASKNKTSSEKSRRPAKERLKEAHLISVKSERHPPIPTSREKPTRNGEIPFRSKNLERVRVPLIHPSKLLSRGLSPSTKDGSTLEKGPSKRKPRRKVIYQKMVIDHELWNFKRSPNLRRLKFSVAKVKEGKNPFFKFKDLFREVQIRSPDELSRYNAILKGGILFTKRSIGIRITPLIRKVRKLSCREMEFLISKLPFWATSYRHDQMIKLAFVIYSHSLRGKCEALSQHTQRLTISPPGPRKPWGVHPRPTQAMLEDPVQGSLLPF
jgi:hypothetical protein